MTSLQYSRIEASIKFEVTFWALIILAAISSEKSNWLGWLFLSLALGVSLVAYFLERGYKKLQEEYES